MRSKSLNLNFVLVTLWIVFAVLSRLLPNPANFSPMMAIGIFGGALFARRAWAIIIPLLSIWLSDLLMNNVVYKGFFDHFVWFYDGWYWQYAIYLLVPLASISIFKKNITVGKIALTGIGAAVLFFLVSNFGVWYSSNMYPKTGEGLLQCYIMGLPFFKGTLMGTLFYSLILFGTYYFIEKRTSLIAPVRHQWRWI
ncbi:MAG: hypothetical protein QM727_13305 [Niabella sp.]